MLCNRLIIIFLTLRCGKHRVVLRKGHIGYNVYFIYSGSVSVVLDKDDQDVFVKREQVILRKGACFGVSIFRLFLCLFLALLYVTAQQSYCRHTDVGRPSVRPSSVRKTHFLRNRFGLHSQTTRLQGTQMPRTQGP